MFAEGKRCVNGTWVLFFTFVEIPWMGWQDFFQPYLLLSASFCCIVHKTRSVT